ncbi:MAPEG family protein [Microbulbifer echini]|uniref:MAPEG family protein n=1 Tax=Microbulbifer echini TaxID=1529067 RepID=A0ABV4NN46_9GAMM
MTTTEITRVKFRMYATPEELHERDFSGKDISKSGIQELKRNHNAHRNLTENTCFFIALALPFILTTPSIAATFLWLMGFALCRFGHTISYLIGSTNFRSIFMTLSLLAMYGIASHLTISWII